MEGKPFHFDGSHHFAAGDTQENTPFELTDEMRKHIGGTRLKYQEKKSKLRMLS
ncbi:hypothetical protein [Rossellomorea vietnamensis]|uniref:hypothetical protein n=1 Tax=Rossellomorea vietnamensis TaxID=218284 RepID=UPI0019170D47|nr:hypothetical protein [Rossellomorea vietnamensis]